MDSIKRQSSILELGISISKTKSSTTDKNTVKMTETSVVNINEIESNSKVSDINIISHHNR